MASGNSPAKPATGTVANKDTAAIAQFHHLMRERASIVSAERGAEVMERQAMAILEAAESGDVSAIERADLGGTIQARDAGDIEVMIVDMEPVVSTREDIETDEGYYVTMNAVCIGGDEARMTSLGLEPGKDFVLQTGAPLFIMKVAALERSGALPYSGKVLSLRTRSGNAVVKLGPLPKRAR